MGLQQQADNLYRQALTQVQQGNPGEARTSLRRALEAQAVHPEARMLLASLLVDSGNQSEAGNVLREGTRLLPQRAALWMALARLEVEQGDPAVALATLNKGLSAAGTEPVYHAFMAALLQRVNRHDEAVRHYLVALHTDPAMPSWLVGIGISLQAVGKDGDAAEAFARARDGGRLSASMLAFVNQKLEQLKR